MSCRARQKSERESETARLERGKNKLQHRQSRWLSKERGCGRGKIDRCENKGDSKSCPDLGRKSGLKGRPLADFARVNKSGVEQFEWSLITLVSLACRLLLSQELFI